MNGLPQASEPVISIKQLRKIYSVHERQSGIRAAVTSLVHRTMKETVAVDDISFDLMGGEMIGFLGPNGAGKTTTIKVLAGLLYPTSGDVKVLGYTPYKRSNALLSQIALLMGQRHQLIWDIAAIESYEFLRVIYNVPQDQYKRRVAELAEMLDIAHLLYKPVRNLSLGERMKCELAGVLLHNPKVLFLDEPTLGLDIVAQTRLRTFLKEYNERYGATVLLTSHYVPDVEALCRRVIFIHQGRLLFDGELASLAERFRPYKTLVVTMADETVDLSAYGEVVSQKDGKVTLRIPKSETATATGRLFANHAIKDLTVSDPPIAEVIEHIFANEDAFVEEVV